MQTYFMEQQNQLTDFKDAIETGYSCKGDHINLGAAMLGEETVTGSFVKIPLKTINRHGLIAGATGTGKTKTLQVLSENLSEKGIPVLLMDLKGDLSGLAQPGPGHPKIDERHNKIGLPYEPKGFPVEILTLSEQDGTRLRATVYEFGPVLLSRILGLSEVQEGILAILFQYCDDQKMGLLDLKDLKKILQYARKKLHIMEYIMVLFVTDLDCRPHEIALTRWEWIRGNKIYFNGCKTGNTYSFLTDELQTSLSIWHDVQKPKSKSAVLL